MKQMIMIALLMVGGFAAKAQCPIEYRPICLDPNTCTVTYVTTTWTFIPGGAGPLIPYTPPTCNPGEIQGIEVRYDVSAGCSYPPIIILNTNTGLHCGYEVDALLGPCACSDNPPGQHVFFNDDHIHVGP